MRKARVTLLIGLLCIVLAVASIFSVVQAQQSGVQWKYAIVTFDTETDTYILNLSGFYAQAGIDETMDRVTQTGFDQTATAGEAAMVDYLAVMGLTGWELVAVSDAVEGRLIIHTFKKPIS